MPYRNSMMTSVLRDSLGGNCKTVMVATMSAEESYLDETISTCRFSQRVALIANTLAVNEELDPRLMVGRLKAEVKELKEEIQLLRGEGYVQQARARHHHSSNAQQQCTAAAMHRSKAQTLCLLVSLQSLARSFAGSPQKSRKGSVNLQFRAHCGAPEQLAGSQDLKLCGRRLGRAVVSNLP